MVKSTLTDEERAQRRREQARERQKRFHEKNKTNPEYLAKRKENDKKITKLMKENPPKQIQKKTAPQPEQEPEQPEQPEDQSEQQPVKNKTKTAIQINLKRNGKVVAKYPKMTAIEVKDFMLKNPNFVLKKDTNIPVDIKNVKKYAGGIPGYAKVIEGEDNFIGAFVNSKRTIELLKTTTTYKTKGVDVEYKPTRFQTWLEYMFSAIRALKRAGLLNNLDVDTIITNEYNDFYQTFHLKKAIQKNKDANNEEYAVPTWDYYEKKIIQYYGNNSIQHLITVLYRYNTVRNDFVNLKITHNKADDLGFYIPKTGNIKVLKNSHKSSGTGHSAIDFTYTKEATTVIRAYIKNNNLKAGDVLLPNSINDVVVDMMKIVHIIYPPTAKAVSVFRNIDSGIGDWNNIDVEDFVNRANRSKHSVNTKLHTYRRIQKDFNIDYPLKST